MKSARFVRRNAHAFCGLAVVLMLFSSLADAVGQEVLKQKKRGQNKQGQTKKAPVNPPPSDELVEPVTVPSKAGTLDSPLTVVFGTVDVPLPDGTPAAINVRAYGLEPPDKSDPTKTKPMIPGPTFVFRPGDLVKINLHNYLNRSSNPALNLFEENPHQTAPGAADDITEHVAHEISIPNNGDITNLHVHGLHVDPKQDNVTLLVLPEDTDPSSLAPAMQRLVPTINRWWTRPYKYQVPKDHVPGTFWYHSHKHGSTATQVENGMAGTLLMLPTDPADDIVPGLWETSRDRVLVVQGILNVGAPQGEGMGPFANQGLGAPVATVNGQSMPTLKLPAGQLERWRFINAGANHKAAGSLWVGKIVPQELPDNLKDTLMAITTQENVDAYTVLNPKTKKPAATFPAPLTLECVKIPGRVKLVAVDGVPMWQAIDIAPASPTFWAAGNRNDLLIQVDEEAAEKDAGPYYVYQNYPVLTQAELVAASPELAEVFSGDVGALRYTAVTSGQLADGDPAVLIQDEAKHAVPNLFTTDPYDLKADYLGFTAPWSQVDADGHFQLSNNPKKPSPGQLPIGPLLAGKAEGQPTNGVDVKITAQNFPTDTGWQPIAAGSGQPVGAAMLMKLEITPKPSPPPMPQMPSDADLQTRLNLLSPASHTYNPEQPATTTKLKRLNKHGQLVPGVPAYVAPVPDNFDGHQVVVFDRGQFTFDYLNKSNGNPLQFRQFWLNGRQFSPDDSVGNPDAQKLIQSDLIDVEPSLGSYSPSVAENLWTHQVGSGQSAKLLVTNPGYYLAVKELLKDDGTKSGGYNYDYSMALDRSPTYQDVTGLDAPKQPESTTAEEWLLINNSDMFHPFHIHISPFFVEEVGQLNYDANAAAGAQWTLTDLSKSDSPFKWVAGNWWDVIVLPPHGYVKMKTWMNVPIQLPANSDDPNSDLVVVENANVYGSWVLHCHILRHEDRGMMTMVNTVPKPVSLSGTWNDAAAAGSSMTISDASGALSVVGIPNSKEPVAGVFNQGLGNPFKAQPWAGAMNFAAGAATFCVTDDAKFILLSNGSQWATAKNPPTYPAANNVYVDLSGTWTDDSQNQATIVQTKVVTPVPMSTNKVISGALKFTPQSSPYESVWWTTGSGTWNAGQGTQDATGATTTASVNYGGSVLLNQERTTGGKTTVTRNQTLSFSVGTDGRTIVFSNGIKWTKNP